MWPVGFRFFLISYESQYSFTSLKVSNARIPVVMLNLTNEPGLRPPKRKTVKTARRVQAVSGATRGGRSLLNRAMLDSPAIPQLTKRPSPDYGQRTRNKSACSRAP